jgi:hypothetical protein
MTQEHTIDEILQSCLDMIRNDEEDIESVLARHPDMADELRPELEAAAWMREQSTVFDPPPGFINASRKKLIAQIQQESGGTASRASPWNLAGLLAIFRSRQLSYRFAVAIILVVFLFVATSGVALASQSSLPGDTLYPVKIGLENVAVAVTPSLSGDARLHIRYADRRLNEIQGLVLESRYQYIASTVDNFEKHVDAVVTILDRLAVENPQQTKVLAQEFTQVITRQSAVMASLSEVVPESTRPEFNRLAQISEEGVEAAQEAVLRSEVGDPVIPARPSDTLTPSPTSTASATPSPSSTASPTASSTQGTTTPTATQPTPTPTTLNTPLTPAVTPLPGIRSTPIPTRAPVKPTEAPPPTTQAPPPTREPLPTLAPEPSEEPPPKKPTPTPTKKPKPTKKPLPEPTRRPITPPGQG